VGPDSLVMEPRRGVKEAVTTALGVRPNKLFEIQLWVSNTSVYKTGQTDGKK